MRLLVTIPGTPQQQGSKSYVRGHGIEANKNLAPWRADAIHCIQEAMAWQEWAQAISAVSVAAMFIYARPKSHYGTGRNAGVLKESAPFWKTSAPDLDKLQRAVGDALTQSGAIRDDALIVWWRDPHKIWGGTPKTVLTITMV